jgi:hypothetical protein
VSDHEGEGPGRNAVNPGYIVLSIAATACLAAGVYGYISEIPQFAGLAGEYQGVLHSNWVELVAAGLVIGAINLLLTLKNSTTRKSE